MFVLSAENERTHIHTHILFTLLEEYYSTAIQDCQTELSPVAHRSVLLEENIQTSLCPWSAFYYYTPSPEKKVSLLFFRKSLLEVIHNVFHYLAAWVNYRK